MAEPTIQIKTENRVIAELFMTILADWNFGRLPLPAIVLNILEIRAIDHHIFNPWTLSPIFFKDGSTIKEEREFGLVKGVVFDEMSRSDQIRSLKYNLAYLSFMSTGKLSVYKKRKGFVECFWNGQSQGEEPLAPAYFSNQSSKWALEARRLLGFRLTEETGFLKNLKDTTKLRKALKTESVTLGLFFHLDFPCVSEKSESA